MKTDSWLSAVQVANPGPEGARKREKTQTASARGRRGDITADPTGNKLCKRTYYGQFYVKGGRLTSDKRVGKFF